MQIAATSLAIRNALVPPTANHTTSDPDCDLHCVSGAPASSDIEWALVNSHGIGKVNSSLILRKLAE